MCNKANCDMWCLRLSHWGVEWRDARCPDKHDRGVWDCMIAPGVCCHQCGRYWVPDLEPDIVEAMALEWKHGPEKPPTEAATRLQFKQYADAAWRAMQRATAA